VEVRGQKTDTVGRLRRLKTTGETKLKPRIRTLLSARHVVGRPRPRRELAELELAKAHGEVMAVKDVELTWGRILGNVRQVVKGTRMACFLLDVRLL
jgi:hypothetical protein